MVEFINTEFLIRMLFALVLGFSLGLERELTNKYAGLRTHILVCLGACIFTIVSIHGFPTFADGDNVIISQATGVRDTARVAAQIVTGIGFIGAGTVLRNGPIIIGLTTAATLWISASIGMACGVGMYGVATIATIFSIVVLTIIRIFEKKILPTSMKKNKKYKMTIYCEYLKSELLQEYLYNNIEVIDEFKVKRLVENTDKAKITSIFELCKKDIIDTISKNIMDLSSPDSLTIQEIND